MKPFTLAFAVMACAGLAMAQTPATTNGGAQRGAPVRKPQPAQKPVMKKTKIVKDQRFRPNLWGTAGGSLASGVNGSDDCAAAPAISGSGVHAWDSSGATTGSEGQNSGHQFNDIWYEWSPGATGVASFSTCNDTNIDTTITVYDGAGCPAGGSYAYNDDSAGCAGFSSHLSGVSVNGGGSYMVQVAGWSEGVVGTGNLTIVLDAPPANDDCSAATALSGDTSVAFDNTSATTSAEQFAPATLYNDLWYDWTATADGIATISTCDAASYDTKLAIHDGSGCPTAPSLAYNDDGGGCTGWTSLVSFNCTAGNTYGIQLGGFSAGSLGSGTMSVSQQAIASNDECAGAEAISGDGDFAFDNSAGSTGTENQNAYICYDFGSSAVDNDCWFAWTATADSDLTVTLCGGTSMDSKMAISDGSCGALTILDCNDDSCGLQSQVATAVTNGSTYYVQVGNFPGASGGSGTVNFSQQVTLDPGDDCSDAIAIAGAGSFAYDNGTCTTGAEGQNEAICYDFGSSAVDNDIWFSWTSDGDGAYVFETCGSSPDTKIAVYDGSGCPTGAPLGCNDDTCGLQSSVTATVVNGSTYTVQCGNFPGATGGATTLTISPPPPACPTGIEDECATAGAIAGQGLFCFDNSGATTGTENQNDYTCYQFGSSAVDNDIWFAWTADADGQALVTLCGVTSMDSKLAISDGTCGALNVLACNDDTCGLQSEVSTLVTNGSTYYIQVGNFPGSAGGSGDLSIGITNVLPPHPNDDCATTSGVLVDGANFIDTTGASYGSNPATGNGSGSCWVSEADVWHSYTAPNSGLVIMAMCNLDGSTAADFDTVMSVHDACGGAEIACSDDFCGLSSAFGFLATAGSTYMVNVGGLGAGETGTAVLSVVSTTGTPFCNGSGGACPCGNDAAQILPSGCVNSTTQPSSLVAQGDASAGASTVTLIAVGAVPGLPGVFFSGENQVGGGAGVAFGDGLRCAGFNAVRLQVTGSDANGNAFSTVDIATVGGVNAGDERNYQYWYREVATGGVCGNSHNLTNGVNIVWGI